MGESRVSLAQRAQKLAVLSFPFAIIPPTPLSHTHTPRKASLTRRIWTFPGPLPKCHQNLIYIFNEDHVFVVLKVCVFRHINTRKLWFQAIFAHRPSMYRNDCAT